MNFGFEKFGLVKKAAPVEQEVSMDSETSKLLQEKIRSIVADLPGAEGLSSDLNIAMTANYLNKLKADEGAPYTKEDIEALGPEFDSVVKGAYLARIGAQPEASGYRVVNKDGLVVGNAAHISEVEEIVANVREHEDHA